MTRINRISPLRCGKTRIKLHLTFPLLGSLGLLASPLGGYRGCPKLQTVPAPVPLLKVPPSQLIPASDAPRWKNPPHRRRSASSADSTSQLEFSLNRRAAAPVFQPANAEISRNSGKFSPLFFFLNLQLAPWTLESASAFICRSFCYHSSPKPQVSSLFALTFRPFDFPMPP